jgi:hypothetical protein
LWRQPSLRRPRELKEDPVADHRAKGPARPIVIAV